PLPPGWQVVWRAERGTPGFIRMAPVAAKPAAPLADLDPGERSIGLLEAHPEVFGLSRPRQELAPFETHRDAGGATHVRFQRQVDGVPVVGEDLTVHLSPDGVPYAFSGRYSPTRGPGPAPAPVTVTAAAAVERALDHLAAQETVAELDPEVRAILGYDGPAATRALLPGDDGGLRAVWRVEIRPNLRDHWRYYVDAGDGAIVDCYNTTVTDGPATATAVDLAGLRQPVDVYQVGATYYLIDGSRSMFAATQADVVNSPKGAIVTLTARHADLSSRARLYQFQSTDNTWSDPAAISAHRNMATVYDYYLQTHGRLSIDGRGGTMYSVVHVTDQGQPMDNAYWNGSLMAYGDGKTLFKPLSGALDVAAHEMTHGVIQYAINLDYRGQSGALNESLADVFAVMVDRANWLIGEDVVQRPLVPSGALRDMADPHNGAQPSSPLWQPATMAEFVNLPSTQDNGGVHLNSGIPNRACYLMAQALGRDQAERIYYRTLDARYLGSRANFVDLRLAALQAAGDLYGESSPEVAAVAAAFDSVGIVGDTGYQAPPHLTPAAGERWLLVVDAQSPSRGIYLARPDLVTADDIVQLTSTSVYAETANAVTVAADGALVLFIDTDNNLRSIRIDGTGETTISRTGDWGSIALAPDGQRLAATTTRPDSAIQLVDLDHPERSRVIRLRRPTTQDGLTIGVILYADALDWDPAGDFLIYDAYNSIPLASGDSLSFWDVSLLQPDDEYVVSLLPPQPEGLQLGNPRFARTTGHLVVYDHLDSRTGVPRNEVWVHDLVSGDGAAITSTGAAIAFPSFSMDDLELVYEHTDRFGRRVVARVPLDDTGMAVAGPASDFIVGARSARWLAISPPAVPTSVTEDPAPTPAGFALRPSWPNPFNSTAMIAFDLPAPARVELTIYDVRGARVTQLLAAERDAGQYQVAWDGCDDRGQPVGSGVYLCRLSAAPAAGPPAAGT
ncbi:MAG: M4 family metallopeptidase, partial [Gemmatimonadota bacterium]